MLTYFDPDSGLEASVSVLEMQKGLVEASAFVTWEWSICDNHKSGPERVLDSGTFDTNDTIEIHAMRILRRRIERWLNTLAAEAAGEHISGEDERVMSYFKIKMSGGDDEVDIADIHGFSRKFTRAMN